MTKDPRIACPFVVILIFSYEGIFEQIFFQHVTKNVCNYSNTSHVLCKSLLNIYDYFLNVQILSNFTFCFENLS
jgi:hypothetical protein